MAVYEYDIEDMLDEFAGWLRDATAGINAQIAILNAQKAARDTAAGRATITVPAIDTTNAIYYLMDDATTYENYAQYIVMTIDEHVTDNRNADTIEVAVEIIMFENYDGTDPRRKMLRYCKALRNVFKQFWKDGTMNIGGITNIKFRGVDFNVEGTDKIAYTSGITLICTNAN